MNSDTLGWTPQLPPRPRTEAGEIRRIGVEIELSGLTVAEVATLLGEALSADVEVTSPYEHILRGDEAGPWRVELDYAYLKNLGREHADRSADDEPSEVDPTTLLKDATEGIIRRGAEVLVPVEVVSPPLPMPRLAEVEELLSLLRRAGAKGTGASLSYAFGMQLNPELPALDATTITRYLQAFLCLYDWLLDRSQIDPTRRLTGYSAGFPATYVRRVIDPDYRPTTAALIDDYLADNPTRNRALDLLPLFTHIDEARVRKVVEDPRVKARPTFHYRLPNSEIDDPEWGVHVVWNDWLEVERLAADPPRLQRVCARYLELLERPLGGFLRDWAEEVKPWLEDR